MLNYVIDQISAGKLFQSIGALNIKAVLQGKKKQQKKSFTQGMKSLDSVSNLIIKRVRYNIYCCK